MYTRKNLTTCQHDVFVTSLSTSGNNAVILSSCYMALVNKLLNYKSVELNNLVASCQQLLSTSWEQAVRTHPVDKLLEQNCCKSFLRV